MFAESGGVAKIFSVIKQPFLSFQVLSSVHQAGKNYPAWKKKNSPDVKAWLNPKQNKLPYIDPAVLSIQRADSLENVDESSKQDCQDAEDSS